MKYTHLNGFKNYLKGIGSDHFSNVYLLVSQENHWINTALDCFKSNLSKGERAIPFKKLASAKLTQTQLSEELYMPCMFSQNQVIVLTEIEKLKKECLLLIEQYIEKPSKDLCLVLISNNLKETTKLYKLIEKKGIVFHIKETKPWEKERNLTEWIQKRLLDEKKRCAPQVLKSFVQYIAINTSMIETEIQKLLTYVGDREEITKDDILAVCTQVPEDNIWHLGEAIFSLDKEKAWKLYKDLFLLGTPFLSLIYQLRRQFEVKFEICTIIENGGKPSDVTAKFPYMRGQFLQAHLNLAKKYGMNKLRQGLILMDEVELVIKNSDAVKEDVLSEIFIGKLLI